MTRQQFLEEIKRLSVAERIALIEAITRTLREDLDQHKENISAASSEERRVESQISGQDNLPISQRLSGLIKFEGKPPTDDELKDAYADYLLEKYS